MTKRLHTYCCRLCLHDGTVHQLLDIFSVKGLNKKILNIFNIKVTQQDAFTRNICLACFNEALTLDREMQLIKEQKQTVLYNQQHWKKSPPVTATSESSAALHTVQVVPSSEANVSEKQAADVPNALSQTLQTAADNVDDSSKRLNSSPKIIRKTNGGKTIKWKIYLPKAKDKKKASGDTRKALSKNQNSSSLATGQQSIAERNCESTKLTSSSLQNSSVPVYSNEVNPVQHKKTSKPAQVATPGSKTKKAPTADVQQLSGVIHSVGHAGPRNLPNNADKTKATMNNANNYVGHESNAVQSSEQSVPILVPDGQSTATNVSNNGPGTLTTLQGTLNEVSATATQNPLFVPATIEPTSGALVADKEDRSVPPLVVNLNYNRLPLQGGLCSIPLANISSTLILNESRVGGSSTANLTGTGVTSLATERPQPASSICEQLLSGIQASVSEIPAGNRDDSTINSTSNSIVHAGSIKKRRHSTYIRVSSNLFDEPPEKAQFAMLNNNQFLRNIAPVTNITFPRMPVLPQGIRVQTAVNPAITMPANNASNTNNTHRFPLINEIRSSQHSNSTVSRRPNAPETITNLSNFRTTAGTNYLPITSTISTMHQQQLVGSASIQQVRVGTNSSTSNNCVGSANNSHLNAHINTNNIQHQQIRPCYKCNLCNTYYLLESNLEIHLNKVHQVAKTDQTYSKVYNSEVSMKLISRYRRKSIADPLLLSKDRVQRNCNEA